MMKRVKRLFFITTITVGGCFYNGFILSNGVHLTKNEVRIGLEKIGDKEVTIYIQESVEGDFGKPNGDVHMPLGVYAAIIHFVKIQSRFFSELSKKLQLLKYYSIGQYIIFKEYMKKLFLHIAKTW